MAWLSNWESRRKIEISNTNVDAILSNFPILIKISASSGTGSTDITDIFTELTGDANRKKIAITTSDGTTQCYVEIERFDFANSLAWLWIKVPSVASGSVTELYIYYDVSKADNTTYVGDTGDIPAQSVWDSNFKLVMHMAQDPNGDVADAIKDSTSNVNHGTPAGAMTSADLVDGKVGKGIDFDGVDDLLNCGKDSSLNLTNALTLESIVKKAGATSGYNNIIAKNSIYISGYGLEFYNTSAGGREFWTRGTSLTSLLEGSNAWGNDIWCYLTGKRNTGGNGIFYIDGASIDTGALTAPGDTATNDLFIGDGSSGSDREWNGTICEIRISDIDRSAAWIKATYYSNWDGLVSFGSKEGSIPEITLPNPFVAAASFQSNIQVELVPGAFQTESSLLTSEPFWGSYAELPSPFFAEGSLQAKTGIDIAITPFVAQANLQSNIQIELVPPIFASQSELSVSEIWCGIMTTLPNPFSANASLHASTQIEIATSPLIATSELFSNIGIEVSAGALNATGAILATPVYPIILTGAKRIYLFTLTGAADGVADIIIPISSFQSRIKSGDPTYLSVVIPGTEYVSAINERLNGDLVVRMGYQDGDEILLTEIISKVLFENITIYEGATNKSIILDGHKTETWTPKTVSLENASYYNLTKGKLRYRCKPDLYLRPGDIANINDNSFTVESITYSVSPMLETYEIAE